MCKNYCDSCTKQCDKVKGMPCYKNGHFRFVQKTCELCIEYERCVAPHDNWGWCEISDFFVKGLQHPPAHRRNCTWKPIEKESEYADPGKCGDCATGCTYPDLRKRKPGENPPLHICDDFTQRACGNCGWHGEHGIDQIGGCLANSGYTFTEYMERFGQGFNCSWKPIPSACGTCGGTGEVCPHYQIPDDPCNCDRIKGKPCPSCQPTKLCKTCKGTGMIEPSPNADSQYFLPCRTCRPAKPEREKKLMVPVRWEHNISNSRHELFFAEGTKFIAFVYLHNGRWRAVISGIPLFDKNMNKIWKSTELEIKTVVEKALGIREG